MKFFSGKGNILVTKYVNLRFSGNPLFKSKNYTKIENFTAKSIIEIATFKQLFNNALEKALTSKKLWMLFL